MTTTEIPEETLAPAISTEELQPHDHSSHEHHHHAEPTLNPELTRTITVEAPVEEVDETFRRITRRYQKLARIPGFRAGKVPEAMIRSRFGKEVRQEVLEALVDVRFRKALEEQAAQPVSQPQVSELQLFPGQPLRFKATFEVLPAIDITGYDKISVERPESALTDEEFQAELTNVLDHHATIEPIEEDRAIADGDMAEISFKGQVQELAQTVGEDGLESKSETEPISGEDALIEIGGKNTLQAFNDALRGAKAGQELTFEATYPAEFGEPGLAGKTVSYDVTVKAIKTKTLPERDAEFAKQLGPYESWEDFEAKLREMAAGRKKDRLESHTRDKMLDELLAKFNFPVPESFVQQQIDTRLERGLRALANQGMTPDAMRKLDFGQLREAQRPQAINEVKASLVMDRIADAENVQITDEDVERELLILSIQSREPMETLRKRLTDDDSIVRIREQMRREKTGTALFNKLAS